MNGTHQEKRTRQPAGWLGLRWKSAPGLRFLAVLVGILGSTTFATDPRGIQFVGFSSFSGFNWSRNESSNTVVLTSPVIVARIAWREAIVSWNAAMPAGTYLKVEMRALFPERTTKFYTMGLWSADPAQHPRASVPHQKDADGDVDTDTLILERPARELQVRVILGGDVPKLPKLKFVGLSLLAPDVTPRPLPPNRRAWGKTIPVPERSQMDWPGGEVWCSPTTVGMMLAYWAHRLGRPELDRTVPEIAQEVHDPNWEGTGNWVFNTAYAGAFPGMRAYTARLSDVAELEHWIAQGLPVGLSVCYNRLRGKGREASGHLVVCVGFTETGDVVINDPGTRRGVRKTFPRANLKDAWAYKYNTVYLIYPEKAKLPKDRFGHWDSPTARRQVTFKSRGQPAAEWSGR